VMTFKPSQEDQYVLTLWSNVRGRVTDWHSVIRLAAVASPELRLCDRAVFLNNSSIPQICSQCALMYAETNVGSQVMSVFMRNTQSYFHGLFGQVHCTLG
jgi:hypothetical protein